MSEDGKDKGHLGEDASLSFEDNVPSLPGMAGVLNPLDEAQLRAEAARRIFEAQEDAGPWMEDYWDLIGEGYGWRQAVYMIWESQPKDKRVPKTQAALAVEVLGLASDRRIREWKRKNPAMELRMRGLQASALLKRRADIYQALIRAATKSDPRAHSDRKLALEIMGDYVPRQRMDVAAVGDDMAEMDSGELRGLAEIPAGDGDALTTPDGRGE